MSCDLYIDPCEEPPVSTNPFAHIPYDVLQYVLNGFLTSADRFNFNQVLEPQERIYKRFPKDYAIRHQVLVSKRLWNSITNRVNANIESEGDLSKVMLSIISWFHYFKEPNNHLSIRFVEGQKQWFLNVMKRHIHSYYTEEFYNIFTVARQKYIERQAQLTCDIINSIPFERDVPTKKN